MVKAKRKPLEEIADAISPYGKVLTVGCGGCVSVCLAGGQREVYELNAELELTLKESGTSKQLGNYTVERQCNMDLMQELDDIADGYDCILSMACGAGVQLMAERYPDKPVFPAVNTMFIGVDRSLGMYEEKCRACGECVLAYTGGICPVTRCAKGLFNGPCGGTNNGMCEVSQEIPCAWLDIYERLKAQDRLDDILKLQQVMQWQNQMQRTVVQPKYEKRYYK
ncbi:methylenetetrahydrofolate reductase C-terminal domain-containing protein [Desulfoluna butyratoxydans]|uniref:Methylene-tetrahydrofolate reductase c-terminal n=1 Tax=Desulfoluna butyratoxydans TaxID=231438 RepID=A0A4U8YLV1_9BACT|nr:methylenetetrahydrofolate reductase C-terminal domain-containing protein [Desulfoluna butyratoxydans]VFQ44975.1 methylene-tetrahydrofolate reductase c-terminal [Desulfoluna butyratoxydans]